MIKKVRYLLESIILKSIYFIFGILPLDLASSLGGLLGRTIGPRFARDKVARKNLELAMGIKDKRKLDEITTGMWDNLGRVFAEFPHIGKLDERGFDAIADVEGIEHIENAKAGSKGSIFFSGHIANWEMAPKTVARCGCPLALVYRKGNNPSLDAVIQGMRRFYQSEGVPKGALGSRRLIQVLRQGGHVGMLLDQKMNDGIMVDFFGIGAMTAPAVATLALKFGCPVIPTKVVRFKGARFKITFMPPLAIEETGDRQRDTHEIMTQINAIMEAWIRENPSQWLWIHNRWPKEGFNGK